jgi:hypothetical protein
LYRQEEEEAAVSNSTELEIPIYNKNEFLDRKEIVLFLQP